MKKTLLALSIVSLLPLTAIAGQGSLNGFLTIGAAGSSESNLRYGADGTMTSGADFVGESKAGIQADYAINKSWSLTAQVVAKSMMNDRERLGVAGEWMFASYALTDETKVRFGKLRLPLFMYSEQLDVGKSYALARLPVEMYGITPTNAYNGVDARIKFDIGDSGELTVQPYAGIARFDGRNTVSAPMASAQMPAGSQVYNTFEADSIKGVNLEYLGLDGRLKLRAGILVTNMDDKGGMTLNMAQMPGMAGMAANNVEAKFTSVGAQYRAGDTTLTAEYGQRRVDSAAFAQTDGYYVAVDHKLGKFVPYVSYAAINSDKDKIIRGTKAAVQEQDTVAVGLGYLLTSSSSVKVEVSQVHVGNDNNFNYYAAEQSTGNPLHDKTFNIYRLNYNLLF
jgi:predicted porin